MVALAQGTRLDKFVIDRVLGEGGFGITYLAEDPALGKKLAIKEYFPQSWASRDQTDSRSVSVNSASKKDYSWGLRRFLEEARTLAKFSHPHIVNVNSILEANNTAYMVLDYADGQDFGSWLKGLKRRPTQEELDGILKPLLDAVSLIHANGILHRDIAPDNIYIRHDGSPVLLDFGAARDAIGKRTGTISAIVKHGYSPFEQYSSSGKDQGQWSDIYALGATLYKAVTGDTPPEAADRVIDDGYVPARETASGAYRASFLAAIDHALRRNYRNRPGSIDEWREELFADDSVGERKTVVAGPARDEAAKRPPETQAATPGFGGGPLRWAAALLIVVLLGAGGYYLATMRPAVLDDPRIAAIEKDQTAWDKAERIDTIASYRAYLDERPDGRHRAQAEARIAALEFAAREANTAAALKGKQDAAANAWAFVKDTNDERVLRAFLRDHGVEPFAARARARLGELAEEKEQRKNLNKHDAAANAWAFVKDTNDERVLRAFLRDHGVEPFAARARARLGELGEKNVAVGTFPDRQKETLQGKYKPGDEFQDCDACPEMVVVPAGGFTMGSPANEKDRNDNEGPQRSVTIPKPFAVGKFEVTFAEWDACVAGGGCNGYRPGDEGWGRGKRPAINVSWDDAKAYAAWLSKKTGKAYRLLSEAEWEYAARAGTTTPFSTGQTITIDQANFNDILAHNATPSRRNRQMTVPVDEFDPNTFGLHNMHGNVSEWVEDCLNTSYKGAPTDGSSWTVGDCSKRMMRGGNWSDIAMFLRSAGRMGVAIDDRFDVYGFRVARTLTDTSASDSRHSGKAGPKRKDVTQSPPLNLYAYLDLFGDYLEAVRSTRTDKETPSDYEIMEAAITATVKAGNLSISGEQIRQHLARKRSDSSTTEIYRYLDAFGDILEKARKVDQSDTHTRRLLQAAVDGVNRVVSGETGFPLSRLVEDFNTKSRKRYGDLALLSADGRIAVHLP